MGRPSQTRSLAVWMNGELTGHWRLSAGGGQEFLYAESWLASAAARPISLSLPLRPSREPYRAGVEYFFDNLLPDNRRIRERMQRRFRANSIGAFDLLAEVGRDCVGALQLLSEDAPAASVRRISSERLTPRGVERFIAATLAAPLGQQEAEDEAFRISLAGAQEKTALLWHEGAWHRPTGATPTTHILKLPIGVSPQGIDLTTSVENEWLCAQLVAAYGIAVAPCRMETFGAYRTLVVERFDRRLAENKKWWMRLPQEDLCQATGTPPGLKYESDGGPGIRQIMDLLLGSERAEENRRDFMRTQLVFWLLAAIDGHAKNFSIFLRPGGAYELTPRYDILSAHPIVGRGKGKLAALKIKMAMAVEGANRHYHWDSIRARHWLETGRRCGLADMLKLIGETIERTPAALAATRKRLPKHFPPEIAENILDGVAAAAERLKAD
ncbi:MAG: type II toxin-antitoxin system HipA family toxin [Opitutaceae bacterium]